jgi:iron complex outermembrane receptor protein
MASGFLRGTHVAFVASLAYSGLVCAEPGPAAGDTPAGFNSQDQGGLQEIIVTAQKREQRLIDVGITAVVATSSELQTAGVSDINQLTKIVPGFTTTKSAYDYPIFSMRGVNLNLPYLSAHPTVSTYMDEAILAYPAMTQGILLDVERVEVLKGPQGTLFGANATGGSINVVAAKPTNYFSAGVQTSINSFGEFSPSAYISGPISSTVNARLAAQTSQWGAWQKCYSSFCNSAFGNANSGAARLIVDWKAADTLKISLNANANYDKSQPQIYQLSQVNIQVVGGVLQVLRPIRCHRIAIVLPTRLQA